MGINQRISKKHLEYLTYYIKIFKLQVRAEINSKRRIEQLKHSLRVLLCLVLLTSICDCTLADNKVTLDPNAGGTITAKIYAGTDAHLEQKVTYEARFQTVQQIIDDLHEMTGVKLVAGTRDSDWVVRSRKMNIFVKDVPLSDLMDSIARTMKFRWSRYDNVNPPIYRLKVDRKAAAEADAMMKRAEKKKEEIWRKRRDEWIDAIMQYGTIPISDAESLRESNPVVFRYARYGAVQALRALFVEVPETKTRFSAGQGFRISSDKLSNETRELLYDAGNGYWKYLQMSGQVGERTDDPPGYGDILRPDETFDIAWFRMDEAGCFTPGLRWGGSTQLSAGYFHLMKDGLEKEMADLRAINEDWSKFLCERNNYFLDNHRSRPSEDGKARYAKLEENLAKEDETLYPSEPIVEHNAFPELEKKVKPSTEPAKPDANLALIVNNYIASIQKAIFDSTGIGIVSDSWANIAGEKLPEQEMKLGELLEKFSKGFNYNWDKNAGILEFRHRKWAKVRLSQIPGEWVASWGENTAKNGYLTLDSLAEISNLTYDQAEESIKLDKVLGYSGLYEQIIYILDRDLLWLRFYSSLGPQMKTLLTGPYGVNGHMLTSEQWKLAQPMFDRIGSSRGDALFRLSFTTNDKTVYYRFKEIDTDYDYADREWELYLPAYTPPANNEKEK